MVFSAGNLSSCSGIVVGANKKQLCEENMQLIIAESLSRLEIFSERRKLDRVQRKQMRCVESGRMAAIAAPEVDDPVRSSSVTLWKKSVSHELSCLSEVLRS